MLRITCDYALWRIIEDSKQYKLVLYADKKYKKSILKMLTFVDVVVDGCVSDMPCGDEKSVYDLLFENRDEMMVLVCKDDFQSARRILGGMGFQLGVSFKNINHYSREIGTMPIVYDPMLGYNIGNPNAEAEGFRIFGDLNGKGVRVLTLGGSTTDAYLYAFKSWSECLHDQLNQRGVSNVVMCGGVVGYRSSEELIKLIRDGFVLNPDIVINYSSVNDCFLEEYPYINNYMREMCNYINETVKLENDNKDSWIDKTTWGDKGRIGGIEDMYSFWKTNQTMIHAVCQVHGVRHITFLQPSLFNGKKRLSEQERLYALNLVYVHAARYKKADLISRVPAFHRLVQEDVKNVEWLHDLSDVLGKEDVYIDYCHLNERGNQVIAEKIAEYISV